MKIRPELLFILLILAMSLLPAMWNEAVNYSYSSSYQMSNYPEAARWLVENMEENESALVPFSKVFEGIEPRLIGRLRAWSDVWKDAGISLEADDDPEDLLAVRRYLIQFLKQKNVVYMLNSPNDPYCARLLNSEINDQLVLFRVRDFYEESSLWNEPITVYSYATGRREIFRLNLTTEPKPFETRGNVTVFFDEFGMHINCQGDSNVYIPIFVNSSPIERLSLSVYMTSMSEAFKGDIVLYLDKDGDGSWGGWDKDTGITTPIPQKPPSMIFMKDFYNIEYNIIQIGLAFYGESRQFLAIETIVFYEAYELSA